MTKAVRICNKEKTTSSINDVGKTEQLHVKKKKSNCLKFEKKNQTGLLSHTLYKNKLKMD